MFTCWKDVYKSKVATRLALQLQIEQKVINILSRACSKSIGIMTGMTGMSDMPGTTGMTGMTGMTSMTGMTQTHDLDEEVDCMAL